MKSMLLLGAAALVAAQVGTARAEPVELKMALWGPPQAYLNAEILVPWAKEVEKASGGTLRIRVFQNTLGNPRTVYGNIVNGVADLGWVIQPAVRGKFVRTSVVELPYQFDSGEVGSVAIWRLYASGVIAAEYGDVVPLSIVTFPPAQIHSKTRVVKLADLKGMKVRIGGATAGFVSKLLGATGVYVAIADVYTALNKDLVTGAIMDWGGIKAFRLEQVTKFHLDEPLSGIAGMVAMNKRSWATLSPAARAAFKGLTGEVLSRRIGRAADGEADQVRALVRKLPGHEIVKLSAPERAQWIARLQPVIANWVSKTPDGAKVLAAFQAEVKRLQAR